ncbi:DUF3035 domain-containing protein [Acetobacteraceae bacterium]|nr:DUF3035 domain-containing protein [Acetobacteraceae bacterium]
MKISYHAVNLAGSVFFLGTVLVLSGCSSDEAARAFGLKRSLPDEYTVTTRAPLSMPPSERMALPGGEKGEGTDVDKSASLEAMETLSPEMAIHPVVGEPSPGQTELSSATQRAAATPDSGGLAASEDPRFINSLMFWKGPKTGNVVNADEENHRLRRNEALGRPMNEGPTPTEEH